MSTFTKLLLALALLVAPRSYAQTISGTFKVVCLADKSAKEIISRKACLSSRPQVSFNEELTLAVEHAPDITFDDAGEPNPAELILFLDGKPLPGTKAQVGPSQLDKDDVTTTLLTFRLARDLSTTTARNNWKDVLAASHSRPISVSAGMDTGPAAWSNASIDLVAVRPGRIFWWALFAAGFAVIAFWLAWRTGALRDKEPPGSDIEKPADRAYSLSRVQMAFWTVLAVLAYVYIWLMTGEYNTAIPTSLLGLMGVSVTTFAAAAAVDANKVGTAKEKLLGLRQKAQADPAAAKALAEEEPKLQANTTVAKTEGFARDIATSAAGAALHRLQFILWTLVLGAIFLATVWKTIAMPDFSPEMLGLMGLASGGYVTLKVPEQKK